ncbi:hypothetical protein C9J85_08740 [Haloferax sp. wsp5]|nr:hypothetical protein C9J85_08740 [Haloferax sp. wsp5]
MGRNATVFFDREYSVGVTSQSTMRCPYVLAGATTYGFVLLSLSSNFRERVQQLLSESRE